jgi:hypothetical protein
MRVLLPFLVSVVAALPVAAQECEPRQPLSTAPVIARSAASAEPWGGHRLVVKFSDAVLARADENGQLISRSGADLSAVKAITGHARFAPLIRLSEAALSDLQGRAQRRSGTCQPDLAGLLVVKWPDGAVAELQQLGTALQDLPEVEYCAMEALGILPPADIPPTTPDLTHLQLYHGPDPGMDMEPAWALEGGNGDGIQLSDCEYAWTPTHEDLNDLDLHLESGQTIHPDSFEWDFDEHGTAVLGEIVSTHDGYGCTGLATGVEVHTYPEWTVEEDFRRITAITHAVADSDPGDVVLLEMQAPGAGGDYGPAELDQSVWTVTRSGVDAGVVIVAAAGNGNQNLDAAVYSDYMAWGDSGAILVGAGTRTMSHDQAWFSTYGSRVDVHAWGEWVVTTGYGDYAAYGGPEDEEQYYTAEFGGTSSASPMVAAACAVLQGISLAHNGDVLAPEQLRELLIATGIPQGSGGHIGPFVQVGAALRGDGICSCADGDGDGHHAAGCADPLCLLRSDCDDGDASVNPAQTETCGDGLDNDCDGLTDGADPECGGDDDDAGGDDDASDDDHDHETVPEPYEDPEVTADCACGLHRSAAGGLTAPLLLVCVGAMRGLRRRGWLQRTPERGAESP